MAVHASARESERARDASCTSLRADPLSTYTTAVNGAPLHSKDFAARPKILFIDKWPASLEVGDMHSGNNKTRGTTLDARPVFFHLQPAPRLAMDTTTQSPTICHGASLPLCKPTASVYAHRHTHTQCLSAHNSLQVHDGHTHRRDAHSCVSNFSRVNHCGSPLCHPPPNTAPAHLGIIQAQHPRESQLQTRHSEEPH